MTDRRPSDEALGLPRLNDIESDPGEPENPTDDTLGLPEAADVAHEPSLAGIEHLVDPTKPRPRPVSRPETGV